MSDVKPKQPSCDGRQFARNPYGENYFDVSRDSQLDEIPEGGGFKHQEATPGQGGNPNYSGRQYDDDVKGGRAVSGANQVSRSAVQVGRANRGSEQ